MVDAGLKWLGMVDKVWFSLFMLWFFVDDDRGKRLVTVDNSSKHDFYNLELIFSDSQFVECGQKAPTRGLWGRSGSGGGRSLLKFESK